MSQNLSLTTDWSLTLFVVSNCIRKLRAELTLPNKSNFFVWFTIRFLAFLNSSIVEKFGVSRASGALAISCQLFPISTNRSLALNLVKACHLIIWALNTASSSGYELSFTAFRSCAKNLLRDDGLVLRAVFTCTITFDLLMLKALWRFTFQFVTGGNFVVGAPFTRSIKSNDVSAGTGRLLAIDFIFSGVLVRWAITARSIVKDFLTDVALGFFT